MKHFLSIFFALAMTCISLTVKAQSPADSIQRRGTLFHKHHYLSCVGIPFYDDKAIDKPHWAMFSGGLFLGGGPVGHQHGSTMELGWLNVLAVGYYTPHHNQRLSLGVGIMSRDMGASHGMRLTPLDGRYIAQDAFPDGVTDWSTNISVTSITFPLMIRQRLHKCFNVYAGAVGRWNVKAHARSEWCLGDKDVKEDWGVHGVRRFNVDWTLGIDAYFLGAYVKYSPWSDFKHPNITPDNIITFGATLAF